MIVPQSLNSKNEILLDTDTFSLVTPVCSIIERRNKEVDFRSNGLGSRPAQTLSRLPDIGKVITSIVVDRISVERNVD